MSLLFRCFYAEISSRNSVLNIVAATDVGVEWSGAVVEGRKFSCRKEIESLSERQAGYVT